MSSNTAPRMTTGSQAKGGALPRVAARPTFSMIGYTRMDLGIVKYHFEIGAGAENFAWAE